MCAWVQQGLENEHISAARRGCSYSGDELERGAMHEWGGCVSVDKSGVWQGVLVQRQAGERQTRHRLAQNGPGDSTATSDSQILPKPVCRCRCYRAGDAMKLKEELDEGLVLYVVSF